MQMYYEETNDGKPADRYAYLVHEERHRRVNVCRTDWVRFRDEIDDDRFVLATRILHSIDPTFAKSCDGRDRPTEAAAECNRCTFLPLSVRPYIQSFCTTVGCFVLHAAVVYQREGRREGDERERRSERTSGGRSNKYERASGSCCRLPASIHSSRSTSLQIRSAKLYCSWISVRICRSAIIMIAI